MTSRIPVRIKRAATALVAATMVVLTAPVGGVSAAPAVTTELQSLLDDMVAAGVPGALGLVRHDGRTWRGASGLAAIERARPMRPGDRFRSGSVTKTFVSTVVLQLVAERRLRLDDSVERRLPGMVPNGRNITLRQLLNHTSGLFNYTEDPRLFEPYAQGDFDFVWEPEQLLAMATDHPPLFAPGTRHSYSNTGYVILGLIIESVTHSSMSRQLQSRILRPLDLRDTNFPAADARIAGPHADGYLIGGGPDGGLLNVTGISPSWAWAAGAMVSTSDDIARFYQALLRGRLLPPDQLREMLTTVPVDPNFRYGLGIAVLDLPCGTVWGHDGGDIGYQVWALQSRDTRDQAVMLVNANADGETSTQGLVLDATAEALCLIRS